MNNNNSNLLREEYISRINSVQDYIEANFSEKFTLEGLAKVACFSPYHFHRIFSTMTGETLFHYIQRIRLEKAAFLLRANRKTDITKIALECGFSNQASFAKAFKGNFGVSASSFRAMGCATESNIGKVWAETSCYNRNMVNNRYMEKQKAVAIPYNVEVKSIQDINVVYIRHTGPYKQDSDLFCRLYAKLWKWAESNGSANTSEIKLLTLFHDKLDLTEDDRIRISVCMSAPGNVAAGGELGRLTVSRGKYAIGHFELAEDQYGEAWSLMMADWLPGSGYQPDDRLCFELYPDNTGNERGIQKVDIYIPVKPL